MKRLLGAAAVLVIAMSASAGTVKRHKSFGDGQEFADVNSPSADPCWEINWSLFDSSLISGDECTPTSQDDSCTSAADGFGSNFPFDVEIREFTLTMHVTAIPIPGDNLLNLLVDGVASTNWGIDFGATSQATTCDSFFESVDGDGLLEIAGDSCKLVTGSGGRTDVLIDRGEELTIEFTGDDTSVPWVDLLLFMCPQDFADLDN